MIRRLVPGRDIYRVQRIPTSSEGGDEQAWGVFRYSHDATCGFRVSEHDTRDQARAAKIKHEENYDAARGR
jgi:hypothetical protein